MTRSHTVINYALFLIILAFLMALTNVKEWENWIVNSIGVVERVEEDTNEDNYFLQSMTITAGRIAHSPHDSDGNQDDDLTELPKDDDRTANLATIPFYSTDNVVRTIHSLTLAPARLLMYHPSDDTFVAYTLAPSNSTESCMFRSLDVCLRCRNVLPILVDALLRTRPDRFLPDQPPFQMLFSISDFTTSTCMKDDFDCSDTAGKFAPWLQFGSVFRDSSILPTVLPMPTPNYLMCLWEWRWNNSIPTCSQWPLFNTTYQWDELNPKVIWRGTGFPFLPSVGKRIFDRTEETKVPDVPFDPRRKAHHWSTELDPGGFLDSRIVPWKHTAMTRNDMSKYKYQIDFGGAGGTSWTGTLTKLVMPGLLLHHETPTMDWFFDGMKPWYHYVPVRTDLSDLKDRFEWAESHPTEARQIAQQGTNFSRWFFSNTKMQNEYETLCDTLANVVDAYDSEESVESIIQTYHKAKVSITRHSICTKEYCDISTKPGDSTRYHLPPRG